MDMNDVIALVNTNRGNGKKESLNRMQLLLEKVGNPQKQLNCVHVAGTNGKGTTSSIIASILKKAGLKTGLYTSPHLEVINERIRINHSMISDGSFIEITEKIQPFVFEVEQELKERLYSFEILTAVAFTYFANQRCDIVVLETGIGGRLDATNVIQTPEVAVITSIGMDHTKVLGNHLTDIAKEKAGIIKQEGSVVLYPIKDDVLSVFEKKIQEMDADARIVDQHHIELVETSVNGQTFHYNEFSYLSVQMVGGHQLVNASLAIEVSKKLQQKGYTITEEALREGLKEAFSPGRMEKVWEEPIVFLDGAHNKEGIKALRKNIDALFPHQKITFIVGMMKDKEYRAILDKVADKANQFFLISPDPWRGFDPVELANKLEREGNNASALKSISDVTHYIVDKAEKNEVIVVFGSFYLVGDVRKSLLQQRS